MSSSKLTSESERQSSKANRLVREKSPYLLEHAYNPVDWYPWGEEAFQKARKENKPIFLSIGYSSCHWCHVFRRESLEDPEIAEILNSNFVCIKVDREERPDVDEIYMKAVMSMTGSGGWPLNVFLTPSLEPFYGGTYFPPVAKHGLPAFRTVLKGISDSWRSERESLLQSASQMSQALRELYSGGRTEKESTLDDSILDLCFNELAATFDREYGGFGSAPKFPSPSNLFFLLRYYKKTGAKAALLMVRKTLDHMASGGIYDHVGGGFHRYSTDREWLIPHFEKMLYDNALLSLAFTEAYLVTKDECYRKISEETLEWVLREMSSGSGGYFSAQDADSPQGEGSFYVWNASEIRDALFELGQWDSKELDRVVDLTCKYFGITVAGNFEVGRSVLTISKQRIENISKQYSMSMEKIEGIVEQAKIALREYRNKRDKPFTDDKVLVSWNGLMISAMSRAYQAYGRGDFLSSAQSSANFILSKLTETPDGRLSRLTHRHRDGDSRIEGMLEDYAYFINGLLDLYEASFELNYLKSAIELGEAMISGFFDQKKGGLFEVLENSKDLIARPKEAFDGALPSPNSIATLALFRLGELTAREEFTNEAEATVKFFFPRIESQPSAFAFMLSALFFRLGSPKEIVFSGDKNSRRFNDLLQGVRSQFAPNSVVLFAEEKAKTLTPLVEGRVARPGDQPKVFVCTGKVCKLPVTEKEELLSELSNSS
jgi:uncharacterized protein YyaL (SSP411 family)